MTERDVLELKDEGVEPITVAEETAQEAESESVVNFEEPTESETTVEDDGIDYESLMREDLAELQKEFAELGDITSITELSNPLRYAALRDLGLSPKEAYMATSPRKKAADNRSHLSSAVSRSISRPATAIPPAQLRIARELFRDMSDAEINALYRRVTK